MKVKSEVVQYVAWLEEEVAKKVAVSTEARPMSATQKATYEAQFAEAVEAGMDEALARSVIYRIASEWERIPLHVAQALVDVRKGMASEGFANRERKIADDNLFDLNPSQKVILHWLQRDGQASVLARVRERWAEEDQEVA